MTHLVIMASGEGTNAVNLINRFRHHPFARVVLLICDRPTAPVIEKARALQVPVELVSKDQLQNGKALNRLLRGYSADLIVLAGFLRKIPEETVRAYPRQIINIHPALLPAFGGKGMYGMAVHQAVINAGVRQSGITIHFVNEHYDAGEIIFQKSIPVLPEDTPESLMQKVRHLEHRYYPEVIETLIRQRMAGRVNPSVDS
jgi:phosphoribosylglycinamide formyltransferase-1